ncbi:MAG: hypothetical protein Q7R93_03780, partial [bacterium]|nr:hypothetical protein [bacterium]
MFPSTPSDIAMAPHWSPESGLYRPTTLLSYWTNFIFTGNDAFGFHLLNLLLYTVTGFLIYRLLAELSRNRLVGYLTALLFLTLPIHSEVVANITGRSELLALFFSLLLYLECTRSEVRWWKSGLWMLLAIGSKETAIAAAPIAILVLYMSDYQRGNLARTFSKPIFFVSLAQRVKYLFVTYFTTISALVIAAYTYFVLRFFALGPAHFFGVEASLIESPFLFTDPLSRVATALQVLWMYVAKTFVPFGLCSDYTYNQLAITHSFLNTTTLAGSVVFVAAIGAFVYYLHRKPLVAFASGIFLFSFLPVSNLLFPIGAPAGERWFYYPSLGFAIIVSYVLATLLVSSRRYVARAIATCLVFVFVMYTLLAFTRQSDWLSNERLFASAVRCAPQSVLSHSNMGAIYILQNNLTDARRELETANDIAPIYSKGLSNLGLVYWREGEKEKAREMYHAALQQSFPYAGAMENLALLYLSEGKPEDARRWLNIFFGGRDTFVNAYLKGHTPPRQ